MKLNKKHTFLALLGALIFLSLLYQSVWIFSDTTRAEVQGTEVYRSGSYRSRYRVIYFIDASYTVDYKTYYGAYLKNGYDGAAPFQIRYLIFAPGVSRANTFIGNWGTILGVFVFFSLILSIAFIRKDIFSDQAFFVFQFRRPFIKIEQNEIIDYDVQVMDKEQSDRATKDLKASLRAEKGLAEREIKASVYKFNPNAIAIFIVYMVYFFWYFSSILFSTSGYTQILVYGAILVFVPLYVQNTNNKTFKAKILDGDKLVFSTTGVQFGDTLYPTEQIDAAVVYLEGFDGFKYRERTTLGNANTTSAGDNNKISYRCNGEMTDITFYLGDYKDYFAFRNLMADWSSKGINVLLQKVFEDEFIIQEMAHFHIADK